jgi:hypothetical protein
MLIGESQALERLAEFEASELDDLPKQWSLWRKGRSLLRKLYHGTNAIDYLNRNGKAVYKEVKKHTGG